MSFDKETRNLLARTVGTCRRRLVDDVTDQLRGMYGLHPDGTVLPIEQLTYLSPDQATAASRLRDLQEHYAAGAAVADGDRRKAAFERMTLEIAFTALNRLAALRLCEERGLVVECVRKGTASDGFQMFERISGGALGGRFDAYRVFLECLFDELALDLGVLFDRNTPQSAIFPTERCVEDVLTELNKEELSHLWTEDETIGWVYQYFNPPEERRAMRDASQAPRNSRELAVRNQFFTPRYVVAFLTDNTLGRIWYEMRKGDTALKDKCRFLFRRPNEIFVAPEESAPAAALSEAELSREELLKKPAYIEHRHKKDPRDLRVLDPACGSGHFLLYAFDLLEPIYEEAWADTESPCSEVTGRPLREEFESLDGLRRATPKLIIEHNLHGIDIDPRAVQIAALAIWLRAQKTWKSLGVKPNERPQITRSNIVTAEPMPGEDDMRREFTESLKPKVLGQLVDVAFEKMRLAGEAGSLLKIEEEIKDVVAEARTQWIQGPRLEQAELFPDLLRPKLEQQQLRFDLTGVTEGEFWEQAEDRILSALKLYAEQRESGHGTRRRLFANDAARGFAFINLCRQRYHVALMNPPFGDASVPSKPYINEVFGDTKGDVYKAFVECFEGRLVAAGYLGVISSRAGFFLGLSEDWRTRVILRLFRPIAIADLGIGVLDAMVEVAAYVLRSLSTQESRDLTLSLVTALRTVNCDSQGRFSLPKWQAARGGLKRHQASAELERLEEHGFVQRCIGDVARYKPVWQEVNGVKAPPPPVYPPLMCIRACDDEDKGAALLETLDSSCDARLFACNPIVFSSLPGQTFGYWISSRVRKLFTSFPLFQDSSDRLACITNPAGNDARYFRCFWEPPPERIGRTRRWVLLAKGGEFSRYYADQHLVVDWDDNIGSYRGFLGTPHRPLIRPASVDNFFRCGLTYSRRSQKGFSVRALPANSVFHDKGPGLFAPTIQLLPLLAVFNSGLYSSLLSLQMAFGSYEVGVIQRTPMPDSFGELGEPLTALALQAWLERRRLDTVISTSHAFVAPALVLANGEGLADRAAKWERQLQESELTLAHVQAEINLLTLRLYGLSEVDQSGLNLAGPSDAGEADDDEGESVVPPGALAYVSELLDYSFGAVFGRWDVRFALDGSLAPNPPNPFAALPVCAPGMLVQPNGLPAEPDCIVSDEWLRARPDANSLPCENAVRNTAISNSSYPLEVLWEGILVDDSGVGGTLPHAHDLVQRVRLVLELLWKDKAHEIEQEACEILEAVDLREYLRKPAAFFQEHLKRYSKSRRKAPIYWPLSTASGSYTIWIYYHRLTDQTIYKAVNLYVEPKIAEVERGVTRLEGELKSASGRETAGLTDQLSEARSFLSELRAFREELLRIAALPYRPNLNDGVIINAAPFHKLFRLRSWAKDTEECWKSLAKGDYDWAHLAYTIWPDRVRGVCKRDRSIAIAHGLEDLCESPAPGAKKKTGGRGKRKAAAAEEES